MTININCDPKLKLTLCSIKKENIEDLRVWKNEHREFFFLKEKINVEQQVIWFDNYLLNPDDFMFVIKKAGLSIGCMGIRWQDNVWDIYNVILGRKEFSSLGMMTKAFNAMLDHAYSIKNSSITLKVLKDNPAVKWYLKNNFSIASEFDEYFSMVCKKYS